MTCIVGVVDPDGSVWMGGDSAGVSGLSVTVRADAKVFRRGDWLFGFCGSFRLGQLLRYKLVFPGMQMGQSIDEYVHVELIDAIRACYKNGGGAEILNAQESGNDFLIARDGKLFTVYSDFQVAESAVPYQAVGCGAPYALGNLWTTQQFPMASPPRVRMALDCATHHSGGVRPPYELLCVPPLGNGDAIAA